MVWADEPKEFQEFAVDINQKPLKDDSLAIAEFLHARDLMDIDRIAVSRSELLQMFSLAAHNDWTSDRLNAALDGLEEFRVHMVDNGEETDIFFLHE